MSGLRLSSIARGSRPRGDAAGNMAFDAQVVALCRQQWVSRLLSEDRDFDRFQELRTERLGNDYRHCAYVPARFPRFRAPGRTSAVPAAAAVPETWMQLRFLIPAALQLRASDPSLPSPPQPWHSVGDCRRPAVSVGGMLASWPPLAVRTQTPPAYRKAGSKRAGLPRPWSWAGSERPVEERPPTYSTGQQTDRCR